MNLEDYFIDDDIFADGAGVNKISQAYSKVFENILELAKEGKEFSDCGSSKEINSTIHKLSSKVSALIHISEMDKKIVNKNGTIFNVFGKELSDIETDEESSDDSMTENELIEELQKIIDGCSGINMSEVMFESELNKKNIENDGEDHGDLDNIW